MASAPSLHRFRLRPRTPTATPLHSRRSGAVASSLDGLELLGLPEHRFDTHRGTDEGEGGKNSRDDIEVGQLSRLVELRSIRRFRRRKSLGVGPNHAGRTGTAEHAAPDPSIDGLTGVHRGHTAEHGARALGRSNFGCAANPQHGVRGDDRDHDYRDDLGYRPSSPDLRAARRSSIRHARLQLGSRSHRFRVTVEVRLRATALDPLPAFGGSRPTGQSGSSIQFGFGSNPALS